MEVQIISKKLLKPSVPTPNHLQNMGVSFIDQSFFPASVPIVFYYPADHHHNPVDNVDRQNQLERSLSETLTRFYPLAGRYIKENSSVSCNDEGIEFVEAIVDGQLSRILQGKFEAKDLSRFVPEEVEESATSPLVAVQINVFNCGGLAIGLWFSHRIMDCFSFSMFMNAWTNKCKLGLNDDAASTAAAAVVPSFESGVIFPARDMSWCKLPALAKPQVVTKRFVFGAEAISKLKAEATSQPSTVEIMTAFIWRAQISASRARYGGQLRNSQMSMPMNLRGRTFEKIPENCCGNLFAWINARFSAKNDSEMGLNEFVDLVRGAIRTAIAEFAEASEGEDGFFSKVMKRYIELIEQLGDGDGDFRMFVSWRNFPLYEVDFGWGKPDWVSVTQRPYDGIILVDSKGGDGIEAWLTMDVEDMAHFQQDPNILNFTS